MLSAVVTKMSQTTRRRAVRELVELGLIAVKQVGNGAPTVTAIYPAGRQKWGGRQNGGWAPKMAGERAKNGAQGPYSLILLCSLCSLVVENLKFKPWELINGKTVLRL